MNLDPKIHRNKLLLLNSSNSKEKKKEDHLNNIKMSVSPKINDQKMIQISNFSKDKNIKNLKNLFSPLPKFSSQISLNKNNSEKTGSAHPNDGIWTSPRINKQKNLKVLTIDRNKSTKTLQKKDSAKKVNVFKNYSQSVTDKIKEKNDLSHNNSHNNLSSTSYSNKKRDETPQESNK